MSTATPQPDAAPNFYDDVDIGYCIVEVQFDAENRQADYRFLEVNEAFEHHSGLKDATGQWMRNMEPDHEQFWFDRYAEIARTGRPWRFEYTAAALGSRTFEVFAYRVDAPEQQHVAILFADITARKFEEVRRTALFQLTDELLQDGHDATTVTAAACRLVGNTLGVHMVGYGDIDPVAETITVQEDWTTEGINSLTGTLHFRTFGSYIDDLKRGERVVVKDVRTDPRTMGFVDAFEARKVRSFVNTAVFERGRFVALQYVNSSSTRDWTEDELLFIHDVALRTRTAIARIEAENALRTSEAQHRQSLQQIPSFAAVVKEPDQVIQYVNDAFVALFGERDYIGRPAEDVLPELTGQNFFEPLNKAFSDGHAYTIKAMPIHLLGRNEKRFIDLVYQPTKTSLGQVIGVFIGGSDVTERVVAETRLLELNATLESRVEIRTLELMRTEEALRQSQKMEAVGQLTGGLAHDFNNLLAGISGALELTQIKLQQERFSDIARYTTLAQSAVKRASALTHRLLAFSRRQTLDPKPTNVNKLVNGMLEMIQRTVGPAIEIKVLSAANLWTALVDPSQLENALLNLCINARDAMPEGGHIVIETANESINAIVAHQHNMPTGNYLKLCVTDTGSGMPPEVVERVFEPFFTTKPLGEGTGLGLSMIYGFAQQSGGRVHIDSRLGHGTQVCVYLPQHDSEAIEETKVNSAVALPQTDCGATVLVVDDEPTVRALIADILDEMGYTTIEAGDSAAGLKILQSNVQIDLLVSDVGLPGGMNGRQMADAARVFRPELDVLFITGYAESAVFSNAELEPGMSVMTKPFSVEVIAQRIRKIVERNSS